MKASAPRDNEDTALSRVVADRVALDLLFLHPGEGRGDFPQHRKEGAYTDLFSQS